MKDEQSQSVPVRIDAQEEEYVIPLREYLETNGCEVKINSSASGRPTYHIVTGDASFVKSIFDLRYESAAPGLGIVIGSSHRDELKVLQGLPKIVVVDPVMLTPEDVIEIFSFYFAGNEKFLDKRRNRHEPSFAKASGGEPSLQQPIPNVPVAPKAPEVQPQEDKERIGNIISDVYREETIGAEVTQTEKGKRKRRRRIKKSIWISFLFFCIAVLFPVTWYSVSLGISAASFTVAAGDLKHNNVSRATRSYGIGDYWLHQARFSFGIISFPFRLVGYNSAVRGQERILSLLSDVRSAFADTFVIVKSGKDVATVLLTGHTTSPASVIEKLRISVVSVSGTLGLAKAELATIIRDRTFPFTVRQVNQAGQKALAQLDELRDTLSYIDELLTLYPTIAGFKESKTYLVLLQNSNELRPTGGFIGSVGLMKFEDGTLTDFSIRDVYTLDGQLKGHIDPPQPLKDLLGAEHWYLRDSNWDPDFRESALRAAWFYEKEGGEPVDGVIAVNVPVIVDLLTATGPVTLPDYQDQISAENFFGKSFYYTQHDFFPGSTQKSDFLGTLARTLIDKLTSEKTINPINVFHAVASGLMRKDILFLFNDSNTQQLVEHYGWGGRILNSAACEGVEREFCTFDPIIPAEANMSVSKVNYFVKRTALREISLSPDGAMKESYTLTIRNTAASASSDNAQGTGGSYIPYIRFFVPNTVLIDDVTIDGQPVRSRDTKRTSPAVLPYIENSFLRPDVRGIGVALEIPPGTQKIIRITMSRIDPIPFGRGGSVIDVMEYKHPGVSSEPSQTIIHYPAYWSVTHEGKGQTFLAKEGQLEYNSTISQDQIVRIRFIK